MPEGRPTGQYPAVGELIRAYGLRAKKSWGQCFLHDPAVIEAIARAAVPAAEGTVVEIGAGLGVLTAHLAGRAERVVAIERDRDLVAILERELARFPNVDIRAQNALTLDYPALGPSLTVVGNLPYNIASQLIFGLMTAAKVIRSATVMVQRELGRRLVAPPGSRLYGGPSVLCQWQAEVVHCLEVGRGAFLPPPRVDSSVIKFRFRPHREAPWQALRRVVRAAFAQRRKTLTRALGAHFGPPAALAEALLAADIDGGRRAETLTVQEFEALTTAMETGGLLPAAEAVPPGG